MAKWYQESGVAFYEPIIAQYLHERTRKWYVRFERAAAANPLTVKVYAVLADASAGNANYSGTGSLAVTTRTLSIPLTAGGQAPSLAGAVIHVQITVSNLTTAVGTAVWRTDLGKKMRRARLWVLRAVSKISTANGYFTDFAHKELGFRIWEDAQEKGMLPYIGVGNTRIESTDQVIGGAQAGTLATKLYVRCVVYMENIMGPGEVYDSEIEYVRHDLIRALRAQFFEGPYGGLVDDEVPITRVDFDAGEPDLGMDWARNKGSFEFLVILNLDEKGQGELATA